MPVASPLCLTGCCTIAEVATQRDRFVEALTAGEGPLLVDLAGVAQADVTLVQLLLAARRDAVGRNRAFAVSAWSPVAEDAFGRTGLPASDFAPLSALGA